MVRFSRVSPRVPLARVLFTNLHQMESLPAEYVPRSTNEAKVDQTTEMYFLLSDSFI